MFTSPFQGQLPTIMVSRFVLGYPTVPSKLDERIVCTPYQRVLRLHWIWRVEEVATVRRLAEWWDSWKMRLRISLLSPTKAARQRMTRSYKQRLRRLYERLDDALLADPAEALQNLHITEP
uniref:Uncharacterized protein n=1 Tax=Hyaloperonospora arabidopsidis (strain Emoy2) TaxID=559515 RepID=M4B8S5_HYAAE